MIRIKIQISTNEETGEKEYKDIEYTAGNVYTEQTTKILENSCERCINKYPQRYGKDICIIYPAMKNMVKCIRYDDESTLNWQNYISIDDNKKY